MVFRGGGKRLKLLELTPPGADRIQRETGRWWHPKDLLTRLKRHELGQQDKTIGIAELADAIETSRPSFPPHDFSLHLNELTLAIQGAGPEAGAPVA